MITPLYNNRKIVLRGEKWRVGTETNKLNTKQTYPVCSAGVGTGFGASTGASC